MYKELKEELKKGANYSNELSDWFTLNGGGEMILVIRGEYKFYTNLTSYTKRIKKLINTGI